MTAKYGLLLLAFVGSCSTGWYQEGNNYIGHVANEKYGVSIASGERLCVGLRYDHEVDIHCFDFGRAFE